MTDHLKAISKIPILYSSYSFVEKTESKISIALWIIWIIALGSLIFIIPWIIIVIMWLGGICYDLPGDVIRNYSSKIARNKHQKLLDKIESIESDVLETNNYIKEYHQRRLENLSHSIAINTIDDRDINKIEECLKVCTEYIAMRNSVKSEYSFDVNSKLLRLKELNNYSEKLELLKSKIQRNTRKSVSKRIQPSIKVSTQNQVNDKKLEKSNQTQISNETNNQIEIDLDNINHKIKKRKVIKLNWLELSKSKIDAGHFAELLILREEQSYLNDFGSEHLKPVHSSVIFGDGLGYDIQSFNSKGKKIYIEVKSTVKYTKRIHISPNEIKTMKQNRNNYFIKRVFNVDNSNMTYETETISANDFLNLFKFIPSNYIAVPKK